jgi:hypothetical protein
MKAWSKNLGKIVAIFVFMLGLLAPLQAFGKELTEKQKIQSLISGIERMEGAKFIRNGSSYDAKTAAKFLRGKWNNREDEVATAAEFIEKVASKSSTSGKPYLIRMNGREVSCAEHLKKELAKLEAGS